MTLGRTSNPKLPNPHVPPPDHQSWPKTLKRYRRSHPFIKFVTEKWFLFWVVLIPVVLLVVTALISGSWRLALETLVGHQSPLELQHGAAVAGMLLAIVGWLLPPAVVGAFVSFLFARRISPSHEEIARRVQERLAEIRKEHR